MALLSVTGGVRCDEARDCQPEHESASAPTIRFLQIHEQGLLLQVGFTLRTHNNLLGRRRLLRTIDQINQRAVIHGEDSIRMLYLLE